MLLDDKISKYFTLRDFSKTDTGVANMPPASTITTLKKLGGIADYIYENIGPFSILSAYRSQGAQNALIASGNKQAISKSYHTTGMALDLVPKSMPVLNFYEKIMQNTNVSKLLGAYAIKGVTKGLTGYKLKPTANTIHLDIDTAKRVGVPMYVNEKEEYISFKAGEALDFIKGNKKALAAGGIFLILAGVGIYFYLSNKKRG